jgi:hypothetical protein
MPSSGRAAHVKPVPCPCVASPPPLFSRTPSLARLMPSSALLPRVQCMANLQCVLSRAFQAMLRTPLQAPPAPCRCRLPGASVASSGMAAHLHVVPFPSSFQRACAGASAHPGAPACPLLSSCTSVVCVPLYAPADPLPCIGWSAVASPALGGLRAAPAHLPACCACRSPSNMTWGSAGLRYSLRARPQAVGDPPPFYPCRPHSAVHAAPALLLLICMLSRARPRALPKLLQASMPG